MVGWSQGGGGPGVVGVCDQHRYSMWIIHPILMSIHPQTRGTKSRFGQIFWNHYFVFVEVYLAKFLNSI